MHCVKLRDAGDFVGGGRGGGVGGKPIWLVSITPVTCCSPPQSAQVPRQAIPNIANILPARILKIQNIQIWRLERPHDPQLDSLGAPP